MRSTWPDVIRKANYLIKHLPGNATATVYHLQGLALLEEEEVQQGQEALETALALVSDRQLRLTLLGNYTTLLTSQNQCAKVLKQAKEALRMIPNDPAWLATQEQAQSQLGYTG
jgi:tetratricopeptide (TPR) repeat protein